jgi:hypothetical protein
MQSDEVSKLGKSFVPVRGGLTNCDQINSDYQSCVLRFFTIRDILSVRLRISGVFCRTLQALN